MEEGDRARKGVFDRNRAGADGPPSAPPRQKEKARAWRRVCDFGLTNQRSCFFLLWELVHSSIASNTGIACRGSRARRTGVIHSGLLHASSSASQQLPPASTPQSAREIQVFWIVSVDTQRYRYMREDAQGT